MTFYYRCALLQQRRIVSARQSELQSEHPEYIEGFFCSPEEVVVMRDSGVGCASSRLEVPDNTAVGSMLRNIQPFSLNPYPSYAISECLYILI